MEFNEELKKQAKEIFSLYAKHSPSGYAITEEDFIWTLAEYDSRQSKVSRVELPVKPEIADIFKMIDKLEKDVTVNIAPLTTIGKSLVEGYTKALQHLRNEIRKQFSV